MAKQFGKLTLFAIFLVIIILGMIFRGAPAVEGMDENSETNWIQTTGAVSPGHNIVTVTANKDSNDKWNIKQDSIKVDGKAIDIPKGTSCQNACSTLIPGCKGFMFYVNDDEKGNSASCEFKSSVSNQMNFSKAVLNTKA